MLKRYTLFRKTPTFSGFLYLYICVYMDESFQKRDNQVNKQAAEDSVVRDSTEVISCVSLEGRSIKPGQIHPDGADGWFLLHFIAALLNNVKLQFPADRQKNH